MPVETQSQRRVKYGLNVLVAAVAAVAVTVLINWISYRNFSTGPVRWDLTSTRQYSLSPLTRKVLDRLDADYQIVTLLDPGEKAREDTQLARDLVEEYARGSGRIKVEHINPATDLARREQFERSLHAQFAEQFKPLEANIVAGVKQLQILRTDLRDQLALLRETLLDESLSAPARPDEAVSDTIKKLKVSEFVLQAQIETLDKRIPLLLGYKARPMPNYGGVWNEIRGGIDGIVNQLYPSLLNDSIKRAVDDPKVSDKARDKLLKLRDRITLASRTTKDATIKLGQAGSVPAYDAAISRMAVANPVVIVGRGDVSVLNLADLFRAPTQGGGSPESDEKAKEQLQDKQFLGEERLTGVLARMTVAQFQAQPMVVLVGVGATATSQPAFYSQVKERLESMSFRVEVWQPAQVSQFEPPSAKGRDKPAPVVAEGQRAVWILLPGDPPDSMDDGLRRTLAATYRHIRGRLERGDGVLAIVPPEIDTAAVHDAMLKEWAIEVDAQRVVMQQVVDAYGRERSMPYQLVQQWPPGSPISRAIGEAGMTAQMIWCAPIKIKSNAASRIDYQPIVEIVGGKIWANMNTVKESKEKKLAVPDDQGDERGNRFVIGYAAQRAGLKQGDPLQRLVVISDGAFASDYFGSKKEVDPRTNRTTQFTQFPGNHELLINSVYWLSGMDEMIAASARNQDVRRIAAMSRGQTSALGATMMIGMPLGIFVIGLAVWWSRRG